MDVQADQSQFDEDGKEDQTEDIKRRARNLDKPLDQREKGTEEKVDDELDPGRKGSKGAKGKGRGRGFSSGSNEARSKWGGPIGSGSDTGARSSNQAPPPPGTKRSSVAPASPEGIAKIARTQWVTERHKMETQRVEMYPKMY